MCLNHNGLLAVWKNPMVLWGWGALAAAPLGSVSRMWRRDPAHGTEMLQKIRTKSCGFCCGFVAADYANVFKVHSCRFCGGSTAVHLCGFVQCALILIAGSAMSPRFPAVGHPGLCGRSLYGGSLLYLMESLVLVSHRFRYKWSVTVKSKY